MIVIMILLVLLSGELYFYFCQKRSKKSVGTQKALFRVCLALSGTVLVCFNILEGFLRYGALLLIVAIQIILYLIRMRKEKQKTSPRIGTIVRNMFLYTLSLSFAILFPQTDKLTPTGSYHVISEECTWTDPNRLETYSGSRENRYVTIKIWYPEEEGQFPLILFSHGSTGVLESNASSCEELASNGYVVAAVSHPYQAIFTRNLINGQITLADSEFLRQVIANNGSDDPAHEKEILEESEQWLKIRSDDMNFVIDTLLQRSISGEAGPYERIDKEKIGLFGHSLGGATVVDVARQRDDIDAIIDLEGTMFSEYEGYEKNEYIFRKDAFTVPILDVNSRNIYNEAIEDPDRTYVNFYTVKNATDGSEVVVDDAGHVNFTDLPVFSPILGKLLGSGDVDAKICLEKVNLLVLNYFDNHLKGKPESPLPEGCKQELS